LVNNTMHLLMDTCYLKGAGNNFQHPDLRKLLHLSKGGDLEIFIPHIAWEERRTQMVEDAKGNLNKLILSFESVKRKMETNAVLKGLSNPILRVWNDADIEENSKEAFLAFEIENKITIIPIASDHADRAWARYFGVKPPFNPNESRVNRRKDIPDSWILEAAIDIENKHAGLMALCGDRKLSGALIEAGVKVFETAEEVLDAIESAQSSETTEVENVTIAEVSDVDSEGVKVGQALANAQQEFVDLETKVLGYIVSLDGITKEDLIDVFVQSDVPVEIVKNVAERLSLAGVIKDTGNHYLAKDDEISRLAAASVEEEIIQLLGTD